MFFKWEYTLYIKLFFTSEIYRYILVNILRLYRTTFLFLNVSGDGLIWMVLRVIFEPGNLQVIKPDMTHNIL